MKIAVIGAGISGLTAAYVLSRRHRVDLFEAAGQAGGHARTADVLEDGRHIPIDTGFIVFNEPNYPNLCRLFSRLEVASQASSMSFSVHCEATGQEYNGSSLNQLFGQRGNLARPRFWRMIRDILRFNREAVRALESGLAADVSVDRWLAGRHYSDSFTRHYLRPLGASLWSCDARAFGEFPMRFVIDFLHNHRMLQIGGRPEWRTVCGGSRSYVEKLLGDYRGCVQLGAQVRRVRRRQRGVTLELDGARSEYFDEIVLATHADQSMRLLEPLDDREKQVLEMFPYRRNRATLHTDTRALPNRRRLWAAWNYRVPATRSRQTSVTYNMNILQRLPARRTYCVSLGDEPGIDESRVLRRIDYEHPMFIPGREAAQRERPDLVRRNRISWCGAYWGYGFHEDGVRSALEVCDAFDAVLPQ